MLSLHTGNNIMRVFSKYNNSLLFKGFALTTIGSGISKLLLALATFIFANELTRSDFGYGYHSSGSDNAYYSKD